MTPTIPETKHFCMQESTDNDYDLAIIDRMLLLLMVYPLSKPCGRKTFRFLSSSFTGMSELNDKLKGLDNGADDYLIKPFHIKSFPRPYPGINKTSTSDKGKPNPLK